MIYISKNNSTEIMTDSFIDFIPDTLVVYLDDVLIGGFINRSLNTQYLKFTCPAQGLEEREYIMKIYNHFALIKEELVIVKDLYNPIIKSITNPNNIKMYEK